MILITCQPLDFDITKDNVDLSKSSCLKDDFDSDKMFKKSYEWLFKKLNHSNFIWCYPGNTRGFLNHGEEHVLWTLDVPSDQCVSINASAWNCVINKYPYIEDELIEDISDDDYEKLLNSYKGKEEQTWNDNIFKMEGDKMEVLVKSPIADKFVINKEWSCDYDIGQFKSKIGDGIINNFYQDRERLEQNREILESGLKGRKIDYILKVEEHNNGFSLKITW
jgi:hypothetical protein